MKNREDPRIIDLGETDYTVIEGPEEQIEQEEDEGKGGSNHVVDGVKDRVGETLDFGVGDLSRKDLQKKIRQQFENMGPGLEVIDEGSLTPEQEKRVEEFMDVIDDVFDGDSMLEYGLKSQESITGASEKLGNVKLGSTSIGTYIISLNKQIRGEDRLLRLKRANHPLIRTLGEMLDAIRDGQERRKTLTEAIKTYQQLVEQYKEILKDDKDVLDDLWRKNETDYYDAAFAAIALKRKLDQAEEAIAQEETDFVKSGKSDLMLSEVIGKKQDGLTVARQRYGDLKDSALVAILLSKELRMLGVTVSTMKQEMLRTLNNLVPFIRWSFMLDSIMSDVDMAHNVRESVSLTASGMMEMNAERIKNVMSKVGASSESPLVAYESMTKAISSLVEGLAKLEVTMNESKIAKDRGYKEVKEKLEAINGKKGGKPKKKK